MAKARHADPKRQTLHRRGVLHPRPEAVTAAAFLDHAFFDPRDLLQVKYEMLRSVEADGLSVTAAARSFGLSRPSFYEARSAWRRDGLAGLVPKKRGPRGRHKLTPEVMAYVARERGAAAAGFAALATGIERRFDVRVHPRSIERALRAPEKKP